MAKRADDDADLEPIRLVESQATIDLLERYRYRADIGSIELEKHIAREVGKIAGVRGVLISKSMLDSWHAGKSRPGSQHLPSLQIFFRSKRFCKIVPEGAYFWNALDATIKFGTDLLYWENFEDRGTISEFDGYWSDLKYHLTTKDGKPIPKRACSVLRLASISGYSFSVAHFCTFIIEERQTGRVLLGISQPLSGFLFRAKGGHFLMLRNRATREIELRLYMSTAAEHGPKVIQLKREVGGPLEGLVSTKPYIDYKFNGPAGFLMSFDTDNEVPEEIRKMFDSLLWSVLTDE